MEGREGFEPPTPQRGSDLQSDAAHRLCRLPFMIHTLTTKRFRGFSINHGWGGGIRTPGIRYQKPVFYQLNYAPLVEARCWLTELLKSKRLAASTRPHNLG